MTLRPPVGNIPTHIRLEELSHRIPVIPDEAVAYYKHQCMVCFDRHKHTSGVQLSVNFESQSYSVAVLWNGTITQEEKRAYNDLKKATDFAACTIALLLIRDFTEYTAVLQASARGETIDYYLEPQDADDMYIFDQSVTLEVTGILQETPGNSVQGRYNKKVQRLKRDLKEKVYIAIVEFSQPQTKVMSYVYGT